MLSFLTTSQIETSIESFLSFVNPNLKTKNGNLRSSYLHSLNTVQRFKFNYTADGAEPLFIFNLEEDPIRETILHFIEDSQDVSEHLLSDSEKDAFTKLKDSAFRILDHYRPEFKTANNLLVGCYIIAKKKGYGGGSYGDTLGAIWISPVGFWHEIDYAESFWHEFIHQALYLDDMVNRIFTYSIVEMSKEDALVTSAIRKTKRPYELSFHSACVAAGILDFYTYLDNKEKIEFYLRPLSITVKEMRQKDEYLTNHGKSILSELENQLIKYKIYERQLLST